MHLQSWEFTVELWSVAWPSFSLVRPQICVCVCLFALLCLLLWVFVCKSVTVLFPKTVSLLCCLSIWLRLVEPQPAGHDWPECLGKRTHWRSGLVRAPTRLFKVYLTSEQGNKPSFSKLNWATNPAVLFHTLILILSPLSTLYFLSLFSYNILTLPAFLLTSPGYMSLMVLITEAFRPLLLEMQLSASCEPACWLVLTGSLCCCLASREPSSFVLGG